MKRFLLGAVVAVGLVGCGSSPTAQCKDFVKTLCARTFECASAATKSDAIFIGIYGANETECNSKWNANSCATVTDDKPCTDSTKKYNADKAAACINDYKSASCETLNGGTFSSANCTSTCT